ncbi:hypothetical protein KPSA3_03334 [Pseudomonas syringae pv. actinidiae]|uniref:Uncharacterized protein n=1 Tax=Pseudomonas syringae pv. actinidiae TaxID=103796 RepID=A0AAN4TLI0_PSESF|nr:hypothetical protein KPSA3_03334 [Pseudomonas syringae pv. actinidiae]
MQEVSGSIPLSSTKFSVSERSYIVLIRCETSGSSDRLLLREGFVPFV